MSSSKARVLCFGVSSGCRDRVAQFFWSERRTLPTSLLGVVSALQAQAYLPSPDSGFRVKELQLV